MVELWTFPHPLRNVPQTRPRLICDLPQNAGAVHVAYALRWCAAGIATVGADGTLTS